MIAVTDKHLPEAQLGAEIEITPEMIEAGAEELVFHSPGEPLDDAVVMGQLPKSLASSGKSA